MLQNQILENLEIKLAILRKENAEKLDKIETDFKKDYSVFLEKIFENDDIWTKKFISAYFQLEKLDYPDKQGHERDQWLNIKEGMIKDLTTILNYKHWDNIVTHEPEGALGHIHHSILSIDLCLSFYLLYYLKDIVLHNVHIKVAFPTLIYIK